VFKAEDLQLRGIYFESMSIAPFVWIKVSNKKNCEKLLVNRIRKCVFIIIL
jgi:hypothetical protein